MKNIVIIILFVLVTFDSFSQKENTLLRQGNRKFDNGEYKEAEKDYRKALELNKESVPGQFNLGDAVYKNNNFEEATKIYSNLSEKKTDPGVQSKIFHNLGNSYLQSKEYEKSIVAYKNSLMNNPKNVDTKYNLEYAKMMLKKQQQQQQQNKDNKDQKDDKKDQKDKKDQNQDQNQKNDQQKQPQDQKKISKEDADRMLEALKNDEKKTMQKVKKQKAKVQVIGIEKDW
ncbi:MAG: tetratricopeptide repeat protein [Bacteroidetes bacterium]|nr:tetratricopeptide repeat protein [Bacteroidota bacterium]